MFRQYKPLSHGDESFVSEYGDTKYPEEFDVLEKLSPMHGLEDLSEKPMPPVLAIAGLRK